VLVRRNNNDNDDDNIFIIFLKVSKQVHHLYSTKVLEESTSADERYSRQDVQLKGGRLTANKMSYR